MERLKYDDLEKEKQDFKREMILNYLMHECHLYDTLTTYELNKVIKFAKFDQEKTVYLIEHMHKDELMKKVEHWELTEASKVKKVPSNDLTSKKKTVKISLIGMATPQLINSDQNISQLDYPWGFLKGLTNLVDIKEVLSNYDPYKMITKAKEYAKGAGNKKICEYFEKYTENKEKKLKSLFKNGNIEDNDLMFIKDTSHRHLENSDNEESSFKPYCFSKYFSIMGDYAKSTILEHLDIFSIGKFGLTNKEIYNFVYKKFYLEVIAKKYCLALFKNHNIYVNDQKIVNKRYKTFLHMFNNRPRVRFAGIYYSKVKFNKIGELLGSEVKPINTVFYYRYYRFFPDGEVHVITSSDYKPSEIMKSLSKGLSDAKKGRFYIDTDDTLIMEVGISVSSSYVYRFKFVSIHEYPLLYFTGLELLCFNHVDNNICTELKLNEHMPKLFKFRSLKALKEKIFIYKKEVEIN